jgi:hypothetical protein
MNAKNELNKIQAVLPGVPPAEYEWFDRATAKDVETGLTCWQCGEPIEINAPYTKIELYDSPYDSSGHEEAFHVENGEQDYDSCYDRLTDTGWADFRYFDCEICHRMICRQSPRNGWHTQVRLINDGASEICLRCYEEDILENGIDQESFEEGKISGLFLNDADLAEKGFERVEGFHYVHIQSKSSARLYCEKALKLIEDGFIVATNYERMAIGGLEGYVSMWVKKTRPSSVIYETEHSMNKKGGGADHGSVS